MNNIKWTDFLAQAQSIVQAKKAEWPGCENAQNGGGGGSSGHFARHGGGTHLRTFDNSANPEISALIKDDALGAKLQPGLETQQGNKYSALMADTPQVQPGYDALAKASAVDPTEYTGKAALSSLAGRDPFSKDFEESTVNSYRQRAADAMAQAATGPEAVRGGEARTSIAQGVIADQLARQRGHEVRAAQMQDAQMVTDAAKGAASIEQAKTDTGIHAATGLSALSNATADRGLNAAAGVDRTKQYNMQLLQLASGLLGKTVDTQQDDFEGEGGQSGWQGGVSCCFIFNCALNGQLPVSMELARIEHWTPERERGYTWMAGWLVPAMRRWSAVRQAVNIVLIRPFLRYADWYYGETDSGAVWGPYCKVWLSLWHLIGIFKKG